MKRFVALLVALLLAIAPAIAEFTPYDYHVMYTKISRRAALARRNSRTVIEK